MVTKVRGAFNEVAVIILVEVEEVGKSSVEMPAQVASLDTNNADRDRHLRTNDFFDAAQYPHVVFRPPRINQVDENSFIVNVEPTIKDATRGRAVPIEFVHAECCGREA